MANKQSFTGFFKEGTRYFEGTDEVLLRNIDAAVDLSDLTRTSLGPNGMKKIIKNHIGKLYVTGDCATMIGEAEIQHPAAKMLVNASLMQGDQIGDGTNFVLVFAGELLRRAAELIRSGIKSKDIVTGYQEALKEALSKMQSLYVSKELDMRNHELVSKALKTTLSSHQFLDAEFLSDIVTTACQSVLTPSNRFNVDNIRIAKALGSSVSDSYVFKGFAVQREVAGTIRRAENCKLAVFATGFDLPQSDTKMNTVFSSGAEMENFARSEEDRMDAIVSSIAERGVNVVVCQSKPSEMAIHFLEKHHIMVIQLPSAWDIKRLCRATHAQAQLRVGAPTDEECGRCKLVEVKEVGSTPLVFFEAEGGIATIIVRGSTPNIIDDVERSINDAVNCFQVLNKFPGLVAGAGACEMELAAELNRWADAKPGMDQYGARKFAEALEVIPRTIAENSGLKIAEFMARLRAAHNKGQKNAGVDTVNLEIGDAVEIGVLDVAHVKEWAMKLAVECVVTLLRVDQICMSKPVNGPAPRSPGARDED